MGHESGVKTQESGARRELELLDVIFSDSNVSTNGKTFNKRPTLVDINDLSVYKRSMRLAEEIWTDVSEWPSFAKYSMGTQLAEAADSIAANISEGHGRYHFGENRQFCYYARGSLQETRTWLQKAKGRNLISDERFEELSDELIEIRQMLNGYIRSIGKNQHS